MNVRYTGGAIALVFAVAACDATTPTTTTPTPTTPHLSAAPAPARLTGTVSVAGGYDVRGDFRTAPSVLEGGLPTAAPLGYTCADYAKGASEPSTFVSPVMQTAGKSSVYVEVILASGYHGPSTYDSTTMQALMGTAVITIPPASAPQYDTFRSRSFGTVSLTVRPDGSGSVLIRNWGSAGSDSSISGSASWRCDNPGS